MYNTHIKRVTSFVVVALIVGLLGLLRPTPSIGQEIDAPSGVPTESPGTDVEAVVPDTRLTVQGCAAPNAFVTIFDDNAPVGTVIADSAGQFSKLIVAQGKGLHNIKAYFGDTNNRTSSTVTENISLAAHQNTVLNLLLPTTVEHEPEPVSSGNFLIFRGTTCPFSLVNVILNNNFTLVAQADDRGNWYVIADTENYFIGKHTYQALNSVADQTSQLTQKYQFKIVREGIAQTGLATELTAPQIIEPKDGYLSSSPSVPISGIGPTNTQIEIIVDGKTTGSVFTNAIGEWSFNMFMTSNQHTVQARSCIDSGCTELSNAVRIFYGGDFGVCGLTFELARYRFYGIPKRDGIDLELELKTGNPEYELIIDYGDADVEHITLYRDDPIKFHHIYDDPGQYNGVITIQDSRGCLHAQYFSVSVIEGGVALPWIKLLIAVVIIIVGVLIYRYWRSINKKRKTPPSPLQHV